MGLCICDLVPGKWDEKGKAKERRFAISTITTEEEDQD